MMKEVIVLVDYQNVKNAGLRKLASIIPKRDHIQLFVGQGQTPETETWFIHDALAKGTRIDLIPVAEHGKNNLDFYLAFYLGEMTAGNPNAQYFIFSDDRDFDPLAAHLRERGIDCTRKGPELTKKPVKSSQPKEKATVTTQPAPTVTKPVVSKAIKEKTATLSQARKFLENDAHPPDKKTGLINHLKHHFSITDLQATALVDALAKDGFFKIDAKGKVDYGRKKI